MKSGYCSVIRDVVSDNPEAVEFGDLHYKCRGMIYWAYIYDDHAWFEEIIVGEGKNPKFFVDSFATLALTFKTDEDLVDKLYHIFFELCDSYMFNVCADEYERIRQTTAH